MSTKDWPADDYAIGAYIQSKVADMYMDRFNPLSDEYILDIGCGDGSYSLKILQYIPNGQLLGLDSSENMLCLARKKADLFDNFDVQKGDVLTMQFNNTFDHVVSFWCLQWTDNITKAFNNIYQALKPGGKIFTLFPSGDDPFILSYYAVSKSGQFKELEHFVPPMHYSSLDNLQEKLSQTLLSEIKIDRSPNRIELPDLETFRRFVNGIAFYQGQIEDDKIVEINEAMVQWYDSLCQSEFDGKYMFQFSPYWVTGKK